MEFNQYIENAWNQHDINTQDVAHGIDFGISLAKSQGEREAVAQLTTHIFGEHLGQWAEGVQLLSKLNDLSTVANSIDSPIEKYITTLQVGQGVKSNIENFSPSDQVLILAMVSSALSQQGQNEDALRSFQRALTIAEGHLSKTDRANKSVAITSNNIACSLEEKNNRTEQETKFMVIAALASRKYWELAGTWLEVERAEYRLAMSYLKASDLDHAFVHARNCIRISTENSAEALEIFFGYEVLALIEKDRCNTDEFAAAVKKAECQFSNLSEDDQKWCSNSLKRLLN